MLLLKLRAAESTLEGTIMLSAAITAFIVLEVVVISHLRNGTLGELCNYNVPQPSVRACLER